MGLTELKIVFKEIKRKALEGASTGVVCLILKDGTAKGLSEFTSLEDLEGAKFKAENLSYMKQALIGNVQDVRVGGVLEERNFTPTKLIVYAINGADTLDNALDVLENYEFNYLCMPEATDQTENPKLIEFITKKLPDVGYDANLVITTTKPSNSSDVIEFATEDIKEGDVTYTATKLLPFICGLCAGTPLTQSITHANVPFISTIPKKTKEEKNQLIDGGKLILTKEGGNIKIARGVTSLTTPTGNEGDSFKKIKLVRTYKFINNSIKKSISNYYVGKVANNYDNKCLLIAEISNFLEDLARDGIIERGHSVGIDLDAQKKYLKEIGADVDAMSEQELKEANTRSKVFLFIKLKGVDAMEDFYININV